MSGRLTMVSVESALITEECYSCSVLFALPKSLYDELIRQKGARSFYCPNGHQQHYTGEREEDRLKRELARAEQDRDYYKNARRQLADDNMTLAKQNSTLKGTNTKLRKRALTGTCAFCHRHFANMQRHMETKHAAETTEA